MRRLFVACVFLLSGCVSPQKYTEGGFLSIGAYVPFDSSLYGVELVQYLNGCTVRAGTNQTLQVEREYCATNSYLWGMVEIRETTRTKAQTGNE